MKATRRRLASLALLWLLAAPPAASALDRAHLQRLVDAQDFAAIKELGPPALPALAALYTATPAVDGRLRIAYVFYVLGQRSPEAAEALLGDFTSADQNLRIQVQYTLGRVSDDRRVVEQLLAAMRNGETPRIRDKAACALAYDQIHLTEAQKVQLFSGLIKALADPKDDVRRIAILALQIHTGQTKGYDPDAPLDARQSSILAWQRWLLQYRDNL